MRGLWRSVGRGFSSGARGRRHLWKGGHRAQVFLLDWCFLVAELNIDHGIVFTFSLDVTTCCCRYSVGQKILVGADITANHKGYFEFRVCPQSNPNTPVSEDCLQRHLLQGDGGTRWDWEPELGTKQISMFSNEFILIFPKLYRYYIKSGTGRFSTFVKLPERLRCEHCVLQVFFQNIIRCEKCVIDHVSSGDMLVEITGAFVQMARERWDSMMKRFSWQRKVFSQVGCGPQEEFRGCADISIGVDISPSYSVMEDIIRLCHIQH